MSCAYRDQAKVASPKPPNHKPTHRENVQALSTPESAKIASLTLHPPPREVGAPSKTDRQRHPLEDNADLAPQPTGREAGTRDVRTAWEQVLVKPASQNSLVAYPIPLPYMV